MCHKLHVLVLELLDRIRHSPSIDNVSTLTEGNFTFLRRRII